MDNGIKGKVCHTGFAIEGRLGYIGIFTYHTCAVICNMLFPR